MIFMKNFNSQIMLTELDLNHTIPCKIAVNDSPSFQFYSLVYKASFIRDKFSRIKILLLLLSWCFSLLRLAKFFRLSKAFLQYFLFVDLTMFFLDLDVFLSFLNMWLASDVSESTSTSISLSIDATVASNKLSFAHSGITERTILFLLPY